MLRHMLRPRLALAVLFVSASCGSRTGLDAQGGSGSASPDGGFDAASSPAPDGGASLPDVVITRAAVCHSWVQAHAPVQVSSVRSIVQVQAAIATPSGVLVGYADAQVPPVDPSWHDRIVSFGDGALGPEQSPFSRQGSPIEWSSISLALAGSRGAATASDQGQGLQFVQIDPSGAPTGSVVTLPGGQGSDMLATSTGFSVLRGPWNAEGDRTPPVSLATLDATGHLVSTTTLLDASTKANGYFRTGFSDGTFLLVWSWTRTESGRSTAFARHFAEDGTALAPAVTLRTFGRMSWGGSFTLTPVEGGFLFAWAERDHGGSDLMGQPFDEDGRPTGSAVRFARTQGVAVLALTPAPGGDVVAAWDDSYETNRAPIYVQAVAADGSPEGAPTKLESIEAPVTDLFVVASTAGAMLLFEDDTTENVEVFGIPLRCAE
jgi:hypothetical protein